MNVQNAVEDVVADFVGKIRMFTAYDVTKMVRHRAAQLGLNDRVSHYGSDGVRKMVQDMDRDNDLPTSYACTSVAIGASDGMTAFVYHDMGDDPKVYDSVWVEREIAGVVTPVVTPAPVSATPTFLDPCSDCVQDAGAKDDGVIKPSCFSHYVVATDQRGRVCVPAAAIDEVKAKSDDLFVAIVKQGEVVLIPGSNRSTYPIGSDKTYTYMIDRSGNVRVSRSVLVQARLDPHEVDIAVDPTKREIIIT